MKTALEPASRLKKLLLAGSIVLATSFSVGSYATTILYTQNFENPNPGSFVNDGGDVNIFNPINTLYGGQPAGFSFAQHFTVETLALKRGAPASSIRRVRQESM